MRTGQVAATHGSLGMPFSVALIWRHDDIVAAKSHWPEIKTLIWWLLLC